MSLTIHFLYTVKPDVPIHCTLPTTPSNDSLAPIATGNVLDGRPGSVVRWSCPDGSRLVGKRKTTCLHTGEWSHERPKCEQGWWFVLNKCGFTFQQKNHTLEKLKKKDVLRKITIDIKHKISSNTV